MWNFFVARVYYGLQSEYARVYSENTYIDINITGNELSCVNENNSIIIIFKATFCK